jgi:hypothetical protein
MMWEMYCREVAFRELHYGQFFEVGCCTEVLRILHVCLHAVPACIALLMCAVQLSAGLASVLVGLLGGFITDRL